MQTRRLATSFKQLSSTIAWWVMELQSAAKMVDQVSFQSTSIWYTSCQCVKRSKRRH